MRACVRICRLVKHDFWKDCYFYTSKRCFGVFFYFSFKNGSAGFATDFRILRVLNRQLLRIWKVDGSRGGECVINGCEKEGGAIAVGRPKKYNKKTLGEAVDRYFASITRVVPLTEKVDTGRRDGEGHKIYEDRPVMNSLEEQATVEEFIVPPTVGSLCMALGIHRSTWAEYCNHDEHPEFKDITTKARERMRTYLEQQLLTRKDVKGVIFDLQNNHGYSEKRQIDFSERAGKAISSTGKMTMDEREALLREIAETYQEGAGTDVQADS